GGGRAVVPDRGGDDDVRADRLDHGERAAPLERADLVLVFARQPDAVCKLGRARHATTPYVARPIARAIKPPSRIHFASGTFSSLRPLSSRTVPSATRSTRSGSRTVKRLEMRTPGIEPISSQP